MDGELLRQVMRRVPAAVTVVTVAASKNKKKRGMTVGSFTSVSLDPPLVSFNVTAHARMHDDLVNAKHYAVHLLSDDQSHLSTIFANPNRTSAEQFADVPYNLDANGVPILHDVGALFRCVAHASYPAGDHSLIVGRVVGVRTGVSDRPLLYFRHEYYQIGTRLFDRTDPHGSEEGQK